MLLILQVHAAATLFMTGLIWFVQVVHYPLFHRVENGFADYHRHHVQRTGWVVGPPMLIEAVSAGWIAVAPPGGVPREAAIAGILLLLAIWLSTALAQSPAHRRLSGGFDAPTIARLVRSNAVRTVGWTLRSVLALWMLGIA